MAHFELLPPRASRWKTGAVASLIIHGLLLIPFVIKVPAAPDSTDRIEQLVVFLAPPDLDAARTEPGRGLTWSAKHGESGAIKRPLPREPEPEHEIPVGPPGDTAAAQPETPATTTQIETAVTEIEVDSAVVRDPESAAPVYPKELLAKGVEGSTFVHYVVDTTGRVDTATVQIIRTTHVEFARSVRDALALMKFRPAIQSSHRVRQWVQQSFAFKILKPAPSDTT
jgi:TonB family protein